jgi:hypothetical protein
LVSIPINFTRVAFSWKAELPEFRARSGNARGTYPEIFLRKPKKTEALLRQTAGRDPFLHGLVPTNIFNRKTRVRVNAFDIEI